MNGPVAVAVSEPARDRSDAAPACSGVRPCAVWENCDIIERAGNVEGQKHGRELLYRVNVDQLDRATQSLSDLADTWDKRLTRIKRLAEAVAKDRRRT
jgi:hypothetical protein